MTGTSGQPQVPWQRLDPRVIWVDLVRMVVSLIPLVVATLVFGGRVDGAVLWPAAIIATGGLISGVGDLLRWIKTRYRITDDRVERRSGLIVRSYRSVPRDRIRSVDTSAKLRHRLAGLRVVDILAGDRTAIGEAAPLRLDAVAAPTALRLRAELPTGGGDRTGQVDAGVGTPASVHTGSAGETVLASFRWRWLPYNAFTIWAFLSGIGLAWGAYWLGRSVGIDLLEFVVALADWEEFGVGMTITIAVLAAGALGVVGMGVGFVFDKWRFRLSRAHAPHGMVLRTSHGLLRTRQVDRDETRLRGVELRTALPWRLVGAVDTSVVSTGLSRASMSADSGSTILPKVPAEQARRAASAVLRDDRPLATPLTAHPTAALRRRLAWAVLTCVGITVGTAWLAALIPSLPGWLWLAGPVALPVAGALAVLAYRSLGHTLTGAHLVTSSGLNRSTVVLRRDAVIGWTFRQSVLQRRLGLMTLTATTSAGTGGYTTPDVRVRDAVGLASAAVPGLVNRHRPVQPEPQQATVGNSRTATRHTTR